MAHEEEAKAFHEKNPRVYEELRELALQAVRAGHKRFSIRVCWEVVRWHRMFKTVDESSQFRMNDHYHAWYARLLMEREPELAGVFEVRGRDQPERAPEPPASPEPPPPASEPPREQLSLFRGGEPS